LIDLHFAEEADRAKFQCSTCPIKTQTDRRCHNEGFENWKHPKFKIGSGKNVYRFCPGKATWFDEIADVYEQCFVTMHTGLLPRAGALEDQDDTFVEVLPSFLERWKARHYGSVWSDVTSYVSALIKAFTKK